MHFADLPLLPSLHDSLTALQLDTLTDVQEQALPLLLERKSVVAIAETGSGKTLAYVLPVLDRLKRMEDDGNPVTPGSEPRALVIVPTRELGEQVAGVFKSMTHTTRLRVRTVLGGQKMKMNRESVAGAFEVLVATPGRLERIVESGELSLAAMRVLVLDEADQLLDLGFVPTVMALVRGVPSQCQLALFSATMSPAVEELVGRAFHDATRVTTAGARQGGGEPEDTPRPRAGRPSRGGPARRLGRARRGEHDALREHPRAVRSTGDLAPRRGPDLRGAPRRDGPHRTAQEPPGLP